MVEETDTLRRRINHLAHSNQELRRRLFDLNTVFEISRNLNSILDVDALLDNVLQTCVSQLEIGQAAIAIQTDTQGKKLDSTKVKPSNMDEKLDLKFDCEGDLIGLLKSSKKYMSISQIAGHLDFLNPDLKKLEALGCQICLPFMSRNEVRGILMLCKKNSGQEFEEKDLEFISMLVEHMAVSIENAILYQSEKKSLQQLRSAQRQLIESEKLAVIGQLSASLAHEINNPLGIIKNYLALVASSLPGEDENQTNLKVVEEEVDRIARIVRQLLELCQPKDERMVLLDLSKIVDQSVCLVEKQFAKDGISIVRQFSPSLPDMHGYPDKLKQLFINLLMNAKDSMSQGGEIKIAVFQDNQHLMIDFGDTGCGIPKENIPKLFQPFFTTKGAKSGTGLGLWICSEIINQHSGSISLKEAKQGTTFIIKLPLR